MSRRKGFLGLLAVAVAAAFAAGAFAGEGKKNDKNFEYAVGLRGDLPYSDVQAQVGVPNLIDDMNHADIEFSVHDGDLKAGNAVPGSVTPTTCQTATEPTIYSQGLGYFNALKKPAIFTPGDNDWTDCDRTTNGGLNDIFQLQYERKLFFSTEGPRPAPAEDGGSDRQDVPRHHDPTGATTFKTACSENRRWTSRTSRTRPSTCKAAATTAARAASATRPVTTPSTRLASRPTRRGSTRRSPRPPSRNRSP